MGHGGSEAAASDTAISQTAVAVDAEARAKAANIRRLTESIAAEAAVRAQSEFRLIGLLRELEEAGGLEGFRSMGQWVSWHTGVTRGEAKKIADVAERVEELPALAGAMEEGRIGLSAMAALSSVATPATDAALTNLASTATGTQIEKICADHRERPDEPGPEPFFATRRDRGGLSLRGWLPADDGAVLTTAHQAVLDELHALFDKRRRKSTGSDGIADDDHTVDEDECDIPDDERPTPTDAFAELIRRFLAQSGSPTTGSGADRYLIHIHIDIDGRARFENGDLADRAFVEQLLCDSGLVAMTWIKGVPVWATEKQRSPSTALRRALKARDRCCQYPGCGSTGYLEAHHINHREHRGETSLANMVLICAFHHRFLHRTKRTLTRRADGSLIVTTCDGITEDGTKPWKPPGQPPEPDPSIRFPQTGPGILTQYARSVWSEHLRKLDEPVTQS